MKYTILPILAVGLTTALSAQAEEKARAADHLWQVQIRGISG